MPTSATTRPAAIPSEALRRADAGFTLIEILTVVFLIGVLSFVLMPRIGPPLGFDLDNAGEILGSELRYAAERAVSTGETHRLVIDLEAQEMRLERLSLNDPPPLRDLPSTAALLDLKPPRPEQESKPIPERQGDWHSIDIDGVRIEAVVIGDQELTEDKAAVTFAGDGGADPATLRVVDANGNRLTLQVMPFTSEVKIARSLDE